MIEHLRRLGQAIADWWSFQMRTVSIWLHPPQETSVDRAIREEGGVELCSSLDRRSTQRLRRAKV
jgi:hypothetical protein